MWTSERNRNQPIRETVAEVGAVTLGGDSPGVSLGGERRWIQMYGPGGYSWRPKVGDEVLVLKAGTEGESPCIVGTPQQKGDLKPGEVKLSVGKSSVHLTQDEICMRGQVRINGRRLESIITQIVLDILG